MHFPCQRVLDHFTEICMKTTGREPLRLESVWQHLCWIVNGHFDYYSILLSFLCWTCDHFLSRYIQLAALTLQKKLDRSHWQNPKQDFKISVKREKNLLERPRKRWKDCFVLSLTRFNRPNTGKDHDDDNDDDHNDTDSTSFIWGTEPYSELKCLNQLAGRVVRILVRGKVSIITY